MILDRLDIFESQQKYSTETKLDSGLNIYIHININTHKHINILIGINAPFGKVI